MKTASLKHTTQFLFSLTLVIAFALPGSAATTVFHYRVNDTDEAGLPTIPSVGGLDGIAGPDVALSEDIPTVGVPAGAGNRSIDAGGLDGVNSAESLELDNGLIADEGGFTYETWFKWDGSGDINSIIDYAGTEKLVIDVNQGVGNELRMRINSDAGLDTFIAEVEEDQWYYSAVVFDTLGNELDEADASITGVFLLYLDGEFVDASDELIISEFGDTLDRTIGVSKHPLGFSRDFFNGLLYETRVSLGALDPSEFLYVSGSLPGDFNGNGVLDTEDIDDLTIQSAGQANLADYDLNADSLVDVADVKVWVKDLFGTWIGDSNLDGEFNSGDLVSVLASGTYETDVNSVWTKGDFNGDGRTNTGDLVFALSDGGYEAGPVPAVAAIPEPSTILLFVLGFVSLAIRSRRR